MSGRCYRLASIYKAILIVLEEQPENLVKAISAWKKYSHQWYGWLDIPVSTTQSVSGAIMGVDATARLSAVR